MRYDLAAIGLFGVSVSAALGGAAYLDRQQTLALASERTYAISRMMAAHAEGAIGEAMARVDEIVPVVAAWDLSDETEARAIHDRLSMATLSPSIGAIGVIGQDGETVVTSWSYPSEVVDVSDRAFFQAHKAGNEGPLLLGDPEPGPLSSRVRLIYSKAVRNADGNLHAIIAVAIFADVFNTLYAEVVTWPAARAALYTMAGETLVSMQVEDPAPGTFVQRIIANARQDPSGTAIIDDGSVRRLVSWSRVDGIVPALAYTSQDIEAALAAWGGRTLALAALAAGMTAGFAMLMTAMRNARTARYNAEFLRSAVSEVHHRVKNALQLSVSMLSLRARNANDPEIRNLLENLSGQLVAVAQIQDLLQHDISLKKVDVVGLLARLCGHLQNSGMGRRIDFRPNSESCQVETNRATLAALIVNELLTNAFKHARSDVILTLDCDPGDVVMTVLDDGEGVPDGFDRQSQDGFGLRVIAMMADRIGGQVDIGKASNGGTQAVLRMPLAQDGTVRQTT